MKKILAIALVAIMALTALTACGGNTEKAENVSFGMGVYTYYGTASDAESEDETV